MLGLALGLGPRQRDVRVLPLLLDGVPAVQGEPGLDALAGQDVAGDPLGVPGGVLGARVQEDLRVTRADSDAPSKLAADVFFHLMRGKGLPRLFELGGVGERDRHTPVVAVCHGATLVHRPVIP